MKPAGRILGVAVSDRGVLDQSWPDCPEIKLDQVNLSIRVSHESQGMLNEGTTINRTIIIPIIIIVEEGSKTHH